MDQEQETLEVAPKVSRPVPFSTQQYVLPQAEQYPGIQWALPPKWGHGWTNPYNQVHVPIQPHVYPTAVYPHTHPTFYPSHYQFHDRWYSPT